MKTTLENFKPRLRSGRVTPQGGRIIFETDSPYNQITLPMALADLILLCSGQFSIREIVEKIYIKQGSVPFKAVLQSIQLLHQGGFFENGDELTLSPHLRSWMHPGQSRWETNWRIKDHLISRQKWPVIYYVLTLAVLASGIFGLQSAPQSAVHQFYLWFQRESIVIAFLHLLFFTSLIQTVRHVVAGLQIFLLTGRVYNLSICLGPWGLHFKIGDEVADGLAHRLYVTMFHSSQILFGWAMVFVGSHFFNATALSGLILASLMITLWELNPFTESSWRKLVRGLLIPLDRETMALHLESGQLINFVGHDVRRRENEFARVCSIWGGMWLVAVFFMLHKSAVNFGPGLIADMIYSPIASSWPSFLGAFGWLFAIYVSVQTFVESVIMAHSSAYLRTLSGKIWNKKANLQEVWPQEELTLALEKLPLFSHLHEESLAHVIKASSVVEYFPSSIIMAESEPARDIYVLLDGEIEISRTIKGRPVKWITPLSAVAVFGEASLSNDEPREDEARAKTKCTILKVPVFVLKIAASKSQSVRDIQDFGLAILVSQFFASSPVFRSLSNSSIEFLSHRGSLDHFEAGQNVFKQGDQGDGLYLILRGSVSVRVHGKVLKKLNQGSFFGEISLIANVPRTATIEVNEPSVLFNISSESFWQVLVQHIDLGVFIETISETRLKEDLELVAVDLMPTGSDS